MVPKTFIIFGSCIEDMFDLSKQFFPLHSWKDDSVRLKFCCLVVQPPVRQLFRHHALHILQFFNPARTIDSYHAKAEIVLLSWW